jgi:carbon monoxide dehydrogenase subunit G
LIPGCQQLEQVSENEYQGVMQVMIPAVGGTYNIHVTVTEMQPPERCTMDGEVGGAAGVIKGTAIFNLRDAAGKAELHYEASATITGALGTMSTRLIEGVVKALLNQGLATLNRQVSTQVPSA